MLLEFFFIYLYPIADYPDTLSDNDCPKVNSSERVPSGCVIAILPSADRVCNHIDMVRSSVSVPNPPFDVVVDTPSSIKSKAVKKKYALKIKIINADYVF